MSSMYFLFCAAVTLVLAKPLDKSKVSITELNNNQNTMRSTPLSRSKKSGQVLVPLEVVPDFDIDEQQAIDEAYEDAVEEETDREMSYLSDDDWLYVAKIVQDIAKQREEEQIEAMQEIEMAIAEEALEEELEREEEEAAELAQLENEQLQPVIVLQNDEPVNSPHYVVITDESARQAAIESDPLIDELASELEADAELRDHIDELTTLIRERYD